MSDEARATDGAKMIDVRLSRIVRREGSMQQWIFLVERNGRRGFTIVIGANEAEEIHRVVTNDTTARPLTHQLAYNAIAALDARIAQVDIVRLHKNTFYAELVVAVNGTGESKRIDARPSDALALGLRAGCPIRVAEWVLEEARTDEAGPDPPPEASDPE